LADKLGKNQATISKWVTYTTQPSLEASTKYKLKEVGIDKEKINIKERFAPYITTYKELISTK
jgi:hypothetical protein